MFSFSFLSPSGTGWFKLVFVFCFLFYFFNDFYMFTFVVWQCKSISSQFCHPILFYYTKKLLYQLYHTILQYTQHPKSLLFYHFIKIYIYFLIFLYYFSFSLPFPLFLPQPLALASTSSKPIPSKMVAESRFWFRGGKIKRQHLK